MRGDSARTAEERSERQTSRNASSGILAVAPRWIGEPSTLSPRDPAVPLASCPSFTPPICRRIAALLCSSPDCFPVCSAARITFSPIPDRHHPCSRSSPLSSRAALALAALPPRGLYSSAGIFSPVDHLRFSSPLFARSLSLPTHLLRWDCSAPATRCRSSCHTHRGESKHLPASLHARPGGGLAFSRAYASLDLLHTS